MSPNEITFSINRYDRDGDLIDEGVFIHFGETSVKVANTITEFANVVGHFQKILEEIINEY